MICRFLTIGLVLAFAGRVAGEASPEDVSDLFSKAKEHFRAGNELAETDPEAAREAFARAAARFERLADEYGIRTGPLYYNVGNCHFRMGDVGRAILNYRRALDLTPNDPNLRRNLAYARARRIDRIPEPERTRLLKTVLFWHYDPALRTRWLVFLWAYLIVWTAAAVRIVRPVPGIRAVLAIAVAACALFGGSVAWELVARQRERPGVVLAGEVVARKGDSTSYEPAFAEPLHAGTEFVVAEDRGDWLEVSLADGRRCWLPAGSVGLVREPG